MKGLLVIDVNCALSNHWLHHDTRSLLPTTLRTIDLPLKLDDGRLSLSLQILEFSLICSYSAVENEAHFVLECLLYNPVRHKFPSLFEEVILGSLKYFYSFFQLDHQVDISLYLTEATALQHSRKLVGFKPLWCTFKPISLFGFPDFKFNFIL